MMTRFYSLTRLFLLLTMVAIAPSASAVTLTWVGGGDANDFSDLTNWNGTPTGGTIDTANLIDDYVVDDPTFSMTSAVRLNFVDDGLGNDGSLTFDQGTLDLGTNGIGLLQVPDTFGTMTVNSGSVTAQFLGEMNVSLGGTGVLNLNGGGNPVNISTIDFTSTTSTLHFVAEDEAAFTAEHLNKISVNGVPGVIGANLLVASDGGAGVNVTATIPELSVTIDRQTGNITIENPSAGSANIASYSLTSASGSLDPTDGVWTSIADTGDLDSGGSIDSGSNWLEFTDPLVNTDLSEGQQPGGGGLTLAASGSIDLGDAWIQSPTEDLQITVLDDAGVAVGAVVGYVGTEIPAGDMDFDGDVDAADWPLYRANLFADLTSLPQSLAYQSGDLNGDGVNNELDFAIFKTAFEAGQGPGSFSAMLSGSVPEPSSLALFGIGGTAFLLRRKRKKMAQRSKAPTSQIAAIAALALVAFASEANAVVVWTGAVNSTEAFNDGNYDFSGSTLTAIDESVAIEDDVTITGATINATDFVVGFGEYQMADTFTLTLDGTSLTSNGSGGIGGVDDGADVPSFYNLTNGSSMNLQFMAVGTTVNLDATSSIQFRGAGDPINSQVEPVVLNMTPGSQLTLPSVAEFTEQGDAIFVNGINFQSDPSILSFSGTTATAVAPPDPLSLEINTDTGVAKIINGTGSAVDIDFYKLTSESNSLDVDNWNSIQDNPIAGFPGGDGSGNGWEEGGESNNGELGETYLTDFSTLADGAMINLGSAFNQATGMEDVMFRYRDVGAGGFRDVEATYVTGGGVDGDYNGNGVVDAADYAVWRENLGASVTLPGENPAALTPGVVDTEDYDFWKSRFGAIAGSGAATAVVPEPSMLGITLLGILGWLGFGRRRQASPIPEGPIQARSRGRLSYAAVGASLAVCLLSASAMQASITVDRQYRLGDGDNDSGTPAPGALVGSSTSTGDTFDDEGQLGDNSLQDLSPNNGPTYANVSGRPLAGGSTLGASFDGVDDFLQGARLGLPSTSASSVAGGGPFNYEGIVNRGFQLWANPNSVGNGTAQSLVADTEQHGVRITSGGTWAMQYAGDVIDSGVNVNFDAWSHVMVVRPFGAAGGSRLYVDGIAVAAEPGGYTGADDTPLVVGANSGASPGTTDFYNGVIDDLDLFVMGTATVAPNEFFGDFSAAEDNEFIADALTALTPGDLTGDNMVMGDGSGGANDDVAIFVDNWLTQNVVNEVVVGDLTSRNNGDYDLNGTVDLFDWHVLRTTHVNGASLNLGALLAGRNVPEPASIVLFALATVAWAARGRAAIRR